MILSCQNISKAFQEKLILNHVSFHIEDYDKAAIVGINGAGKSTLLNIITGRLSADEGLVTLSKGKTIGYLEQHQDVNSSLTIYDELLSVKQHLLALEQKIRETELAMKSKEGSELEQLLNTYSLLTHKYESENGYAYKSEVTGVLKGLGFSEEDFSRPLNTLSGGQKTRVALGRLLLLNPDLILLDEPTNHLDLSSIAWLETYLLNYKGAVIIVSHDRFFLDRIANKIIEVDNTKATSFTGNYSAYAEKKEQLRMAEWHAYLNQQRELKHQQEVIDKLRSFNREKSIRRAESREKMLDKIEVIEKPAEVKADMKITLEPIVLSGNDVLSVKDLKKSFDSLLLFEHLSFEIKRGEHVAIIGDNGTGKTTILKLINQLTEADYGTISLGSNVHIGYYDQEHHVLHMEKTLFEEISDAYPHLTNTQIRNTLAAFLFTGEDVFKYIKDLSGGERGRVSLAKLMLSDSNFLILDEPTNHLDITSKEILESAINGYTGTVLYVSHDRYFINKTATRILDLNQGILTNYLGNYDYYLEKKDEILSVFGTSAASASQKAAGNESPGAAGWKSKKEEQAKQRKRENDLKKAENEIETLERRDKEITELMTSPDVCTNVAKLQELSKEKEDIAAALTLLYEKWEELSES